MDLQLEIDVPETIAAYAGYALFAGNLNELGFNGKTMVNTLNQYSFCMAEKDPAFKQALQQSNVLLPDGIAIVAAVKMDTGRSIQKISGWDLHQHLLGRLNQQAGRCFYLGSSAQTLKKIQQRLAADCPDVEAGFYSPPFKTVFSTEDNELMVEAVNNFKPDVLFIGMTAPKQEKWAVEHLQQLNASIICTIGAVFDFYAGTVKRPGKFWIRLGLEWLGRLLHEPKRLWKRYLYYGPVFLFLLIKYKLHLKLF